MTFRNPPKSGLYKSQLSGQKRGKRNLYTFYLKKIEDHFWTVQQVALIYEHSCDSTSFIEEELFVDISPHPLYTEHFKGHYQNAAG